MNLKDIGVVSVMSLAASALAVICFVSGRTKLSDFVAPQPALKSAAASSSKSPALPDPITSTQQIDPTLLQATFFVHYGHLPGHGTEDYDADDTEQDRQTLVSKLETYIASASGQPQEKKRLAHAQNLCHLLGQMHSANAAH